MKRIQVYRYQCEHCGKTLAKKDAMERHERVCWSNPGRECYRCDCGASESRMTSAVAALGPGDDKGMDRLRDFVGGCPDCMASAIRISTLKDPSAWLGGDPPAFLCWDYKEESELYALRKRIDNEAF